MEGKKLHPRHIDGTWRFDPAEVGTVQDVARPARRCSTRSEGDLSAEVFLRLDQGQGLRRIVADLRQPPDRIRALFREWTTPLGDEPIPASPEFYDDEAELNRWETTMREQMATEEESDRLDRELRRGRRQAKQDCPRQA
jgi:hypothetical protein